ncbi:MAG: hypothetical protein ACRDVW_11640 [Acidimicrobiales bacterium]
MNESHPSDPVALSAYQVSPGSLAAPLGTLPDTPLGGGAPST